MPKLLHRLVFATLGTLGLLLVSPTQAQQEQPTIEITSVDTSTYPRVQVYLAAPNGTLPDPASIEVVEDGRNVPAEKLSVEQARPGVAVAIVIDLTRSMRGRGMPGSVDRLQDAREQAARIAQALNPNTDLLSVILFNRNVATVVPLAWADGGGVANRLNTDAVISIPDRVPADVASDDFAYAALSEAIARAIEELTVPQTDDADLLKRLPLMQKVVVVFSDGCDDTRDASASASCEIPGQMARKLVELGDQSAVSLMSVGVGTDDTSLAAPVESNRAQKGVSYQANWQLLQTYAQQVPDSHFFRLFTADAAQAQQISDAFQQEVIAPITARGDQLVVGYDATVGKSQHKLEISSGPLRARVSFDAPAIPPRVRLVAIESGANTEVGIEVEYTQAPIASVNYYIDANPKPIESRTAPFNLDNSLVEPGSHQISVEAVDLQGQVSARTEPQNVTIPAAVPTESLPAVAAKGVVESPTESFELNSFLRDNIISLITLLLVTILAIVVLASPRGRTTTVQATQRVTGVIARMTQLLTPHGDVASGPTQHALVVRKGDVVGSEYPITLLNTYIGAEKALVDIVLSDPYVSGRHASINRQGSDLYLTDVGSSNGTYLNGQRLASSQATLLNPGDLVRLGGLELEYVRRGDVQPQNGQQGSIHEADQITLLHIQDEEDRNN